MESIHRGEAREPERRIDAGRSRTTGLPESRRPRETLIAHLRRLLAVRSDADHVETLNAHEIEPIDLVCVNLYPFERVAGERGVEDAEVIENIDIGGPTLIRAAAKNSAFAAVVVSPESYDAVLDEMQESDGRCRCAPARPGDGGVRLHRCATTAAIIALVRRARGDFPAQYTRSLREGARPLVRREPSPARGVLRGAGTRTHVCRWSRSCTAGLSSPTCSPRLGPSADR